MTEQQNYIDLYTDSGFWMARFRGPHQAEIVAIMGTNELPTPFEAKHVAYPRVLDTIERMNPDATVSCRHAHTSSVPGVGVITCSDCGMRW